MGPPQTDHRTPAFDAETLDLALRGAGMVVFSWALPDGEVVYSGELAAVFGWQGTAEQRRTAPAAWQLVHPDDVEVVEAAVARAMQGRDHWVARYRTVWPDGSEHDTEATGRVIRGEDGAPVRAVGVVRNTDSARGADERFRALTRSVGFLLWTTDATGAVTFVNDAWTAVTGQAVADALGRGADELVHPDDEAAYWSAWDGAVAAQSAVEIAYRMRVVDGTYRWVVDRAQPMHDAQGRFAGHVGGTFDVHDRVLAEQASEEARAQLDAFFAAAPVGLAFYDADLRYLRINETLAAANGRPAGDHLGATPSELFGEWGEGVEAMLRRTIAEGRPTTNIPFTGPAPGTGETRHYLASFYPVRLPGGATAGVGVVATDVTESVLAEQARQALLDRSALMAAVGSILDDALDVERTLQAFSELCVDELAAWCSVDLADDPGTLRNAAVHHRDPAMVELAHELQARHPPDPDAPTGAAHVVRTGEAELWPEIPDEALVASARDEEHLSIMRSLGLSSAIIVPLATRGVTFGALTLVAEGTRRYDERDLQLALELGDRAARAVDAARLYQAARAQERATEEARVLLDTYIEAAPIGIAFFDADLRYVRVNATLAELNGLPAAAHVGKRVSDLLPDMDASVTGDLQRVLDTGLPLVDVEVVGATPADPMRRRHLLVSYYRVSLRDGEALGLGATVVDVSDRVGAEQALRAQRDLYETLLRAQAEMGEGFVLIEDERILYVNAAAERISGRSAQELYDLRSYGELFDDAERDQLVARVDRTLGGDGGPGIEVELHAPGRGRVPVELAVQPLEVDGTRRLVVVARDISERRREEAERERLLRAERRARRETEEAHARARTLAGLSDVLDRSMDLATTLPDAARLLLVEAPVVAIGVLARNGSTVERMAQVATDPEREAQMRAFDGTTFELDASNPTARVLLTGQADYRGDVPVTHMRDIAADPEQLAIIQRVAGRSKSSLPLVARDRTVGVLTFAWDEPGVVPEGATRRHLEELARRLALGIDNAQLYGERAHIASTLQAGLLPGALPSVAGIDAAARYLPAGESAEVGGDFYDLFGLGRSDGWAVVVGDVCGKGAEAAAVTAMARYTLRAASVAGPASPGAAFGLLNTAMVSEGVADRFLTAVLAHGLRDPETGVVELRIACAGHPPPVVLRADGTAEAVACRGPLLGIAPEATWNESTATLRRGDAIVLYTDGVTEAARHEPLTADELAVALVADGVAGVRDADGLADAVRALAERRAGGPLRDDVAILALRVE